MVCRRAVAAADEVTRARGRVVSYRSLDTGKEKKGKKINSIYIVQVLFLGRKLNEPKTFGHFYNFGIYFYCTRRLRRSKFNIKLQHQSHAKKHNIHKSKNKKTHTHTKSDRSSTYIL